MFLCFLMMKSNLFGFLGYAEHVITTFNFTIYLNSGWIYLASLGLDPGAL